jgi:hypothetical protein
MPNYGELKCEMLAKGWAELWSNTPDKLSFAIFNTKTGKIRGAASSHHGKDDFISGTKATTEAKPLVEACRKLLAGSPK